MLTPVILPPGRLKLATSLSLTGSLPPTKTIGIVGLGIVCPYGQAASAPEALATWVAIASISGGERQS